MKNKIVLFVTYCFVLSLSSCLGSDDDNNSVDGSMLAKNCQIAAFALKNDSVRFNGVSGGLDSVRFTIDQLSGLIYNMDSLPYGTEINKVICEISYMNQYAVLSNTVFQHSTGDTLYWNGTDSIDFSKPVRFVVRAYDEVMTKTYQAQVNIHQVDPELMPWGKVTENATGLTIANQKVVANNYNGTERYFKYLQQAGSSDGYRLFVASGSDMTNWSEQTLTGLPAEGLQLSQLTKYNDAYYLPSESGVIYVSQDGASWSGLGNTLNIQYLLGALREGRTLGAQLAAIANIDGQLTFVSMNEEGEWTTGNVVPSDFPLTGFGNMNYNVMYQEYLMVAAGRDRENRLTNKVWSTMDGSSWALLTNNIATAQNFPAKEGAMLTWYDDLCYMLGGIESNGASKEVYTSKDYGINWQRDSIHTLPSDYRARGFASVLVDESNSMLIFGGKTSTESNELDDVWMGRINRLGFER